MRTVEDIQRQRQKEKEERLRRQKIREMKDQMRALRETINVTGRIVDKDGNLTGEVTVNQIGDVERKPFEKKPETNLNPPRMTDDEIEKVGKKLKEIRKPCECGEETDLSLSLFNHIKAFNKEGIFGRFTCRKCGKRQYLLKSEILPWLEEELGYVEDENGKLKKKEVLR